MRDERGEFSRIAERLSILLDERLQEGSGMSVEDIVENCGADSRFNCYPGIPGHGCYPVALFISINGVAAQGKGHLNFKKMMEKFHEHMYKQCFMETRHAVIISNNWVTTEYERYHVYIEQLRRRGRTVEAYFINRGGRVLVDI